MNKGMALRHFAAVLGCAGLFSLHVKAVESPTKAIPNGQKEKVQGIIQGRDGETVRLRTEDNSVVVVDLTDETKIQLKSGFLHLGKKAMDVTALVPGLRIEASGKGNEQGQLVAEKVLFDPNSYRASRALDTRVSPLEARAGSLEGRAGALEGRAGALEGRANDLDAKTGQLADAQKQAEQQIGQVRTEADRANQGVEGANGRISALDDYAEKAKATVYFKFGSAVLTPDAKRDLDDLVQKTKALKGYMIEVAGFTDTVGNPEVNERLSQKRADSVVHYLQMADVPLRRILAPAGLGESHEVADNKTADGRKLNRRVEVRVLVNSTLEGGTNAMNHQGAQSPTAPVTQ